MNRRSRGWSGAAILVAFVMAGAGCSETQSPRPLVSGPAETQQSTTASEAALPLDPASLELVSVMRPDNWALVGIETTWVDDLRTSATTAGLTVEVADRTTMTIEGPIDPILTLLRSAPVTTVWVSDPIEAMRPIPEVRPVVDLPAAGRPYEGSGFAAGDLGAVTIPSPQREPMLRSLAAAIVTIDGQPYARLQIEGGCHGEPDVGLSCDANAVGFAFAAGQHEDSLAIAGNAKAGFLAVPLRGSVMRTSVPRPIVRDAEWIARHDEATLAKIRTYQAFGWSAWDPAWRGRITLAYQRPCRAAAAPGRALADTGDCFDTLTVVVDLASATVIATEEWTGP